MISIIVQNGLSSEEAICSDAESAVRGKQIPITPYVQDSSGIMQDDYETGLPDELSRVSYGTKELEMMLREMAASKDVSIEQLHQMTAALPSLSDMMVEQKHVE